VWAKVEAYGFAQHSIQIVFVTEFRFALARLIGIAENMVVGQQQARTNEKTCSIPRTAITRDFDATDRGSRPPATVQEVDRHKVAVADNALESIRIAALRFEKILTNSEPFVGLSTGAPFASARWRDIGGDCAGRPFDLNRESRRLGGYYVLSRIGCFLIQIIRIHSQFPDARMPNLAGRKDLWLNYSAIRIFR
jgi:hypothetical protein